jgi:hypothetical protein
VAFDNQGRATAIRSGHREGLPEEAPQGENDTITKRVHVPDNYQFSVSSATYLDRENDAIDRDAGRFAQSLVTSMLEGF